MTQTVAVAADRDDVTVVQQTVDQRGGHHLIAEDQAPLLEALVRGQYRRGPLVAARHELEEEHRPRARDRQIPDLIDHQERRMREHLQTLL